MNADLAKKLVSSHGTLQWYSGSIGELANNGGIYPNHKWAHGLKAAGENIGRLAVDVAVELGAARPGVADDLVRAASHVSASGARLERFADNHTTLARDWATTLDQPISALRAALDAVLDKPAFVKPTDGAVG